MSAVCLFVWWFYEPFKGDVWIIYKIIIVLNREFVQLIFEVLQDAVNVQLIKTVACVCDDFWMTSHAV